MSFNGSGSFLINTAGQPVVSGTVISSTAFNALTADLATGLSTCITKDGQTTVTANIPMANYKFTGLGAGSAAGDSANLSQVQSTVVKLLASVSGTDTITAVGSPTVAAYAAGQMFYFVAAGDNTGAVTINIDSLGAKAVTRDGSVALAAGDIKSGEVVVIVYDGTRFQVVSQLNSSGDARFANVSIASSLYVGGVATIVGNAGFSANVSIASALSVGATATITGATTIGGNLTLSAGTANGVLYLNGSKVATSGSALVFDGTNLGIGTSSPALTVDAASGTTTGFSGTAYRVARFHSTAAAAADQPGIILGYDTAGAGVVAADTQASGQPIAFWTYNGSAWGERARISKDGNLGLGVTPSAWNASFKAIEVGAVGNSIFSPTSGGNTLLTNNAYYDATGNWIYARTAAATHYEQISGAHKWLNASSGTAGNAISFTQAMTLDSGGRLLIGRTTSDANNYRIQISQGSATYGSGIQFVYEGAGAAAIWENSSGALVFGNDGSDGDTERARITSGGSWYVGTTSQPSSTQKGFGVQPNSTVGYYIGSAVNVTTAAAHAEFYNPNGTVGSITTTNSATAYNTSSDVRLKKNIVDAEDSGADVDALKVRAFDWKADDFHVKYGFIAQELVNVAPEAVKVGDDGEEITDTWGVDYSKLVPMLVKEIQSLRARVAALEGA